MRQLTIFDIEKKIVVSMATVLDLRISPFMPIDKVSSRSVICKQFIENKNVIHRKTPYGSIAIRNRILTRLHKNIFDAIMITHIKSKPVNDKEIALYFTLYRLAIFLKKSWSGKTAKELKNAISEIADTRIERNDLNGNCYNYGIIKSFKYSEREDAFGIVLSSEYTDYFKSQVSLNYAERMDEILSIKGTGSALIKAIIDFFISHNMSSKKKKIQQIRLDKLLDIINYPHKTNRQITSVKTYLSTFRNDLKNFNISYDKKIEVLKYEGTHGIIFNGILK